MEATTTQKVTTPRGKWSKPLHVFMFIFGVAAFAVANFFMYVYAYPTWPNPGPQSDVRLGVYVTFAVLLLLVFLGRAGRWFATGFTGGLLGMRLPLEIMSLLKLPFIGWVFFLGTCAQPWRTPEGTKARQDALDRLRPAQEARAVKRAQLKWVEERRRVGMDEAVGTRRALLVVNCAALYREKNNEYPSARGDIPDNGNCQNFYATMQTDYDGWRLQYDPITGSDGRVTRFHLRLSPDSALELNGPWIEANEQGLVTMRARKDAPAYAKANPMLFRFNYVTACIRASDSAYAIKGERSVSLEDLIFRNSVQCTAIPLYRNKEDPEVNKPNVTLFIVEAPSNDRIKTAAVYVFTYAPRGARAADGYELYMRPYGHGENGVRSYMRAVDGTFHVTLENRLATANDPLALPCEIDGSKPC